jgi:hypothetical protein
MNIYIGFLTYDGMGGHEVLDGVENYLLLNAPASFGPALEKIELHAHLENRRIPRSITPDRRKYFRDRLAKLPLTIFQRRNRRFEISFLSHLGMAEDLTREYSQRFSVALFRRACHEVVSALSLIRESLTPADKFDFEAFNSCLQRSLQRLPNSLPELREAVAAGWLKRCRREVAEHRANMHRLLRSPKHYKIFTALDFHTYMRRDPPARLQRAFKLRINHIVDSFSMRIPKKTKTQFFHKLNVNASDHADDFERFCHAEGFGEVHLSVPGVASIFRVSQPEAVKRVKAILRRGLALAAKNDLLFARHMPLWRHLLATTDREFDFDLRRSASHRSRRWRCEAVMRITPTAYHYDVVVKDSRTSREVERHGIKTTETLFPFYHGIGFSQLRWDNEDILVLNRKGTVVRRFKTKLPA